MHYLAGVVAPKTFLARPPLLHRARRYPETQRRKISCFCDLTGSRTLQTASYNIRVACSKQTCQVYDPARRSGANSTQLLRLPRPRRRG